MGMVADADADAEEDEDEEGIGVGGTGGAASMTVFTPNRFWGRRCLDAVPEGDRCAVGVRVLMSAGEAGEDEAAPGRDRDRDREARSGVLTSSSRSTFATY